MSGSAPSTTASKSLRALRLHELGRILVVRQGDGQKLHGVAVLVGDALADEGQGAVGRLLTRRVAVEQVDDLLGACLASTRMCRMVSAVPRVATTLVTPASCSAMTSV